MFGFMYTYNILSPIHSQVYVCFIVYTCKYCVCPHSPYGLLDFELKLYIYHYYYINTSTNNYEYATTHLHSPLRAFKLPDTIVPFRCNTLFYNCSYTHTQPFAWNIV